VFFQADYDEIEFQKNQLWRHFSDIIAITSTKNFTIFLFCPSPQSKFLATPVTVTVVFFSHTVTYSWSGGDNLSACVTCVAKQALITFHTKFLRFLKIQKHCGATLNTLLVSITEYKHIAKTTQLLAQMLELGRSVRTGQPAGQTVACQTGRLASNLIFSRSGHEILTGSIIDQTHSHWEVA